ncbi:bifunctional UDP-4-keto-pentose/UDP-xylose synthase [Streptomyces rectiverticillatus]|uniref:bifunctional UDP-4-keto-pentose/UDP-xylose synthase n=1 Tax=Streptomyces rectiverticillatus TaxID=173860 RepID=UPI0015C2DEBA|nr:bifunctional UDP-4-keto-pentose/UDP-xylose synthase [Streptomyces rectiverticillatus]QLE75303.1 bifunctional UDP-4-keto-pentose/UDP-xylose synthase [Streptomyces rectiverticillatus]
MNILVLGAGGFLGSHLTRAVLHRTDWHIRALDLTAERLGDVLGHPRLAFRTGDVTEHGDWIDRQLRWADVCLPLVAVATPATYVSDPLATFDLDFQHNLDVVRRCAATGTRVVFPSSSEVYGMCQDEEFDEYESPLVYGPADKSRWIYAASKQLLDRVIHALAEQQGLRYTLFRPFNWTGPGLDDPRRHAPGSSRVVAQMLGHLIRREPLVLVDGGSQRRCFTHIDDGVDGLLRILADTGGKADGKIFNLGHPGNERSIRELAQSLVRVVAATPGYEDLPATVRIVEQSGAEYYGPGYQDVGRRVPAIHRARTLLGWNPVIGFEELLTSTVRAYLPVTTGSTP